MMQSVFFSIFVLLNALTLIIIFWDQISQNAKNLKAKLQSFKSAEKKSVGVTNLNGFQRASRGLSPVSKRSSRVSKAVAYINEPLDAVVDAVPQAATSSKNRSSDLVNVAKGAILILLGLSEASRTSPDGLLTNHVYNLAPEDLGLMELEAEQESKSPKFDKFKDL